MTHAIIRIQYLIFGGFFFALGYGLLLYQKWLPIGSPAYIRLSMIHGTIIVFFGIVPALFMGLGHYILPNIRGGQMRFPSLEWIALGLLYASALFALIAFLLPGTTALDLALGLNLIAPMICSVNFIATAINPAVQAQETIKLWCVKSALFILSLVLFINFLLLEIAGALKLENQVLDAGLALRYPEEIDTHLPLVWKHVFWFMGHPEVIIILLLLAGFFADGLLFVLRRITA
jgi:heme/copper-type cytochrome/quinol oxidase subunit 1